MLPIFYINLDRRSDRNDSMRKKLEKLSLPASRISAIDGFKINESDMSFVNYEKFILRMKRPISQGEVGCAMSHRLLWKIILEENIPYALILEDDVNIHANLISLLQTPNTYQRYDFINLSSNEPYFLSNYHLEQIINDERDIGRGTNNEKLFKSLDWGNNWKIYGLSRLTENVIACECDPVPALTSGYIISNHAARHFLSASDSLFFPIDYTWRYAAGKLKQSFLTKPLIVQTEEGTDISGRDSKYSLSLKQKWQRWQLKRQHNPRKLDVKRIYG